MSRLACSYKAVGSICHGRVGAGMTLTLDIAVGRVVGRQPSKCVKKKWAKVKGN